MSKVSLTRSALKDIVKECIVEILAESFFSNSQTINEKKSFNKKRQPARDIQKNNLRQYQERKEPDHDINESFNRKIDKISKSLSNDSTMHEIFKDTAATTLQNQIGAESGGRLRSLAGGDAATVLASKSDPTELFAESASKWATLAFSSKSK